MAKHSTEQYLDVMAGVGDKPLRHTVMFESNSGPDQPIQYASELLVAIGGMRQIPGVSERIIAAQSTSSPNVVEEIVVANPTALQGLRNHSEHDKVLDIAVENTNWLVADRLAPEDYEDEPGLIRRAVTIGQEPVMSHAVMAVPETSERGALEWHARIAGVMAMAQEVMIVPPEVEISLDHRKGDVLIARSIWNDAGSMNSFAQSGVYASLESDIADSNIRLMQAVHPIAA